MMELLRRLSYLWNRRRLEREMLEEMACHRELMPADRRTNFGDDLRLREDAREMWGWTWLDRLHQDLTYGVRVLRNAPGFTLTAMLVLVLGNFVGRRRQVIGVRMALGADRHAIVALVGVDTVFVLGGRAAQPGSPPRA